MFAAKMTGGMHRLSSLLSLCSYPTPLSKGLRTASLPYSQKPNRQPAEALGCVWLGTALSTLSPGYSTECYPPTTTQDLQR